MILEEIDFSSGLKFTNLTIKEDVQIVIDDYFQDKFALQNATIFYHLAKIFNLTKFSKTALTYIERCITMVVESNNFVELDYALVAKILASSGLNFDTEIEVFKAADKWLSYNIEERSMFAKSLLLKVRLSLLSHHALKYIFEEPSLFSNNYDCVTVLNEVVDNKENFVCKTSSLLCTHRYCNQKNSDIFICGGTDRSSNEVVRKVKRFDANNYKTVKILCSMKKGRRNAKAVFLKGDIYIFGGFYKKIECLSNRG